MQLELTNEVEGEDQQQGRIVIDNSKGPKSGEVNHMLMNHVCLCC